MSLPSVAKLANFGDTGFGDSGLDTVVRIGGTMERAGSGVGLYVAVLSLG